MKTKLTILAIASAILALIFIGWSSRAINTVSPNEIKARANAEDYNAKAAKQMEAASMYAKTQNFQDTSENLRSTAETTLSLATMESNRADKLQRERIQFYHPFFWGGIFLALMCPILLIVRWLIPTPRPN